MGIIKPKKFMLNGRETTSLLLISMFANFLYAYFISKPETIKVRIHIRQEMRWVVTSVFKRSAFCSAVTIYCKQINNNPAQINKEKIILESFN